MTPPIAFDPGALVEHPDGSELAEASLEHTERGRLVLSLTDDVGDWIVTITLRADFLDELVGAAVRAREAAA